MTLQSEAVAAIAVEDLIAKYYRWWRFKYLWSENERTAKLGPVTICFCRYGRWRLIVTFFGRFTLYDGVLREMRRREYC